MNAHTLPPQIKPFLIYQAHLPSHQTPPGVQTNTNIQHQETSESPLSHIISKTSFVNYRSFHKDSVMQLSSSKYGTHSGKSIETLATGMHNLHMNEHSLGLMF